MSWLGLWLWLPPVGRAIGLFAFVVLTAAATRDQAAELAGREFDARLSSNRTCEIGLSRATGERYESFLFLLEELTRPT